jgi:signal transduction histidine kinase
VRQVSLRFKLGLLLVVLFGVVGAGVLGAVLSGAGHYSDEVNFRLNRDAAAHIADTITPFRADGAVDKDALKGVFMDVMVVNPTLEVYLVDTVGALLAYDAPEEKIVRRTVDVAAAREFLAGKGEELVLGDDPRSSSASKPISVAEVRRDEQLAGYLYIILGGETYDGAAGALQASYILRWGTAVILGAFLIAALFGLGALGALTRPLERLRAAMQDFRDEGRTEPLEVSTRDEIGALTRGFNEMAARIAEQVELLRVTDEERRLFVANVSHDLRTPTATVQGYLETLLIKSEQLEEGEREAYLRIALSQVERLGKLVDELFELARLEARDVEPHFESFRLAELASDVVAKFGVAAGEAGVSIGLDIGNAGAVEVEGDVGLFERVFDNLVDNAIRHTPVGGAVRVRIAEADANWIEARVEDTGPGVPPVARERVFERFFRGEDPIEGGTGLGLAIVKRIVELHGGVVEAEDPPEGASFVVRLPRSGK